MKKLYCEKCREQIGEISKGRIRRDTILICRDCQDADELERSADNINDAVGNIKGMGGFENIFNDILSGKA